MNKGLSALLFFFIAMGGVLSAAPTTPSSTQPGTGDVQLMFIQTAEEAIVTRTTHPRKYILTLKNINPEVAYVSDRPTKMAGKTTIQSFLREWNSGQEGFSANNPNAALVTKTSNSSISSKGKETMVVLTNPRFDTKSKTLSYDIQTVGGSDTIEEGAHEEPVLFIDSNCFMFCS